MVHLQITYLEIFNSFSVIFLCLFIWKLYYYFQKKSQEKVLTNYVKFLHWKRLESIKRIKHSIKITKEQIDHVTGLTLKNLINELKKNNLNVKTVLEAYTSKAIDATEKTNCVAEFLFDDALAMAGNTFFFIAILTFTLNMKEGFFCSRSTL